MSNYINLFKVLGQTVIDGCIKQDLDWMLLSGYQCGFFAAEMKNCCDITANCAIKSALKVLCAKIFRNFIAF